MLTEYIQAAMRHARYEILPDDNSFYGEITDCQGVWANTDTLEECREELREVLEEWITLGLTLGHFIPALGDAEIIVRQPA